MSLTAWFGLLGAALGVIFPLIGWGLQWRKTAEHWRRAYIRKNTDLMACEGALWDARNPGRPRTGGGSSVIGRRT